MSVQCKVSYKPVVLVVQLHPHFEKIQFGGIVLSAFRVFLRAHYIAFLVFLKGKL